MVYECGELLVETDRFDGPQRAVADVDLLRLRQDRQRQGTFDDNRRTLAESGRTTFRTSRWISRRPPGTSVLRRRLDRYPFVPTTRSGSRSTATRPTTSRCRASRALRAIGHLNVVIGVSGGLDSTHALIVAAKMDRLGRPRTDIHAYTLPGFATSAKTKDNATRLCEALGVKFEEIDIRPPPSRCSGPRPPLLRGEAVYDVTFENVQAGLRTDYLFRLANHRGGIVLGTGDMSELALGCTYGVGDQMSHYGVNAGIPRR